MLYQPYRGSFGTERRKSKRKKRSKVVKSQREEHPLFLSLPMCFLRRCIIAKAPSCPGPPCGQGKSSPPCRREALCCAARCPLPRLALSIWVHQMLAGMFVPCFKLKRDKTFIDIKANPKAAFQTRRLWSLHREAHTSLGRMKSFSALLDCRHLSFIQSGIVCCMLNIL